MICIIFFNVLFFLMCYRWLVFIHFIKIRINCQTCVFSDACMPNTRSTIDWCLTDGRFSNFPLSILPSMLLQFTALVSDGCSSNSLVISPSILFAGRDVALFLLQPVQIQCLATFYAGRDVACICISLSFLRSEILPARIRNFSGIRWTPMGFQNSTFSHCRLIVTCSDNLL